MPSLMHVVLVRWSDEHDVDHSAVATALVDARLRQLGGVLAIHRGPNVSDEGLGGSWDWGMTIRFSSRADLDRYLPHPDHEVVGAYLTEHSSDLLVFDIDGERVRARVAGTSVPPGEEPPPDADDA